MTNREFYSKAAAYASDKGCDGCETFYAGGESFEVNANGGEIDRYSVSREAGISVRVSLGGKQGYAYTEKTDDPERLIDRAIDNAKCIESGDLHPMQGKCEYRPIAHTESALAGLDEQARISLAKKLEQAALAADTRVQRVVYCSAIYESGRVLMQNTNGLFAEREQDLSMLFVMPSVKDGDEVQTGFAFRMGADAGDAEGCAKEAVQDALDKLGGKPVDSGTYRVLFKPYAFCDLLAAFSSMFSAEEAQRGRSLLAQMEGKSIASESVTLTDDPFDPIAPRTFDGEGTPCICKSVIKNGVLKTLLHNLKTAKKAGVESTGNASRASAASTVGVAPTIFRIEAGDKPFGEMVKLLGNGLIITELEGLHAGVDTVSGDYSLKAAGFLVENGVVVRPVSGVTAAGNFIETMKNVSMLGNDVKYALPQRGYYASPSVLVEKLTIAGN
jgi:PmbA protein